VLKKSAFRKLIFLPWTISVLLLCIGSLINFHQNRIWHKPLLPEFVGYKRDNEKRSVAADLPSLSHPNHFHLIVSDAVLNPANARLIFYIIAFVPVSYQILPPVIPVPVIHGLRAPPVA
jgi:hypothetical protein